MHTPRFLKKTFSVNIPNMLDMQHIATFQCLTNWQLSASGIILKLFCHLAGTFHGALEILAGWHTSWET